MLCLTICQPYAALLVTPDERLPPGCVRKHCENRTWETRYRGPLLIHAGKSKKFLGPGAWPRDAEDDLVFGAIVGIGWLEDCVRMRRREDGVLECPRPIKAKYASIGPGLNLDEHPHCEGPYGWMLLAKCAFAEPIPLPGAQGLFDVDDALVLPQVRKSGFPERLLRVLKPAGHRPIVAGPRF